MVNSCRSFDVAYQVRGYGHDPAIRSTSGAHSCHPHSQFVEKILSMKCRKIFSPSIIPRRNVEPGETLLTVGITSTERRTLLVPSLSLLSAKTGTSTLRPQERPPAASVTPLLTPDVVSFLSFRKDRFFSKNYEDEDDDNEHDHHRFRPGLKGRSADSAHRATCGALRQSKQIRS